MPLLALLQVRCGICNEFRCLQKVKPSGCPPLNAMLLLPSLPDTPQRGSTYCPDAQDRELNLRA